ncbi:helix-turn-helix transcriptional regulator [Streptomyces sp. NPDC005423]|uniref:helix-turn-helix domain-containing protein n=1 Tax=Streptomyces sp. NPDC005423 TaxID=3155343 RepID=UPI0033B567AE
MPGLRREEVAQLASISTDYYTRVEQGRMRASVPVLEAVARALRLDEDERRYLFDLAQAAGPARHAPRRRRDVEVPPLRPVDARCHDEVVVLRTQRPHRCDRP